eukprot:1159945-Pelagomonas_calceolata.AAC.8
MAALPGLTTGQPEHEANIKPCVIDTRLPHGASINPETSSRSSRRDRTKIANPHYCHPPTFEANTVDQHYMWVAQCWLDVTLCWTFYPRASRAQAGDHTTPDTDQMQLEHRILPPSPRTHTLSIGH